MSESDGTVIANLGLLNISASGGEVLISVPEIRSEAHRLGLIAELYRLCEDPPSEMNWVIDLSALKIVPPSFVGIFVALGLEAREKGRNVRIVGADRETLPADMREKLAQWFPSPP